MNDLRGPSRLQLAEAVPAAARPASTWDDARMRTAQQGKPRPGSLARYRFWAVGSLSLFWLGALAAYVWGFLGSGLAAPPFGFWLVVAGAAIVPIVLVAILVELAVQARALARATREMSRLALRITEPEGVAADKVASVGSAVRREIDHLTAALDQTLDRVAAIETMIENQVGAVERSGNRAQMRAQMIRDLLQQERDSLTGIAEQLSGTASAIVHSVSAQVTQVREANDRAAQEIRGAEAALGRQYETFRTLTENAADAIRARTEAVEAATRRFESASTAGEASAQAIMSRLDAHQTALAGAAQHLEGESRRLEGLIERERDLVIRVEAAAGELAHRLEATLQEATGGLDAAIKTVRERTVEAGRDLRMEAEEAARVGERAARTIEDAAQSARDAAAGLRAGVDAEMAALGQSLSEGMRSLDGVAQTVNRSLAGTSEGTRTLLQSLEGSVDAVDGASGRLIALLESIAERANAAQGALDEAADVMHGRFASLPELAAEHAARLQALLEDQARRMGALASAITRREEVGTPLLPRPEPLAETPEPVHPPTSAPAARAAEATPEGTVESLADRRLRPPIFEADLAGERAGGLGALGRWSRRLRAASAKRAPAEEPSAGDEFVPVSNGNGGFWSALFARIEGEETLGPVVPRGASVSPATLPESGTARIQHALEALYALAIDLDRLLEEDPPMDLWKRYRSGEADAFARRLVAMHGTLEHRMRQKYRDDAEFREHANRYCSRYEALVAEGGEPGLEAMPAGQLYRLIEAALKTVR